MHIAIKSGLSLAVVAGGAALAMRLRCAVGTRGRRRPPPPCPVVTAPVQQHDVPIVLSGLGTVQALNTATIRSQVTGLLQTVDFVEGQTVHRGDVLAQIDPRPVSGAARAGAGAAHPRPGATGQRPGQSRPQLAAAEERLRHRPAGDRPAIPDRAAAGRGQVRPGRDRRRADPAQLHDADRAVRRHHRRAHARRRQHHPPDRRQRAGRPSPRCSRSACCSPCRPPTSARCRPRSPQGRCRRSPTTRPARPCWTRGQLLLVNNLANPNSGTVQLKALFPNLQRRLWPGTFVNVELTDLGRQARR